MSVNNYSLIAAYPENDAMIYSLNVFQPRAVCKEGFNEDKTKMQCIESELHSPGDSGPNLGMNPGL